MVFKRTVMCFGLWTFAMPWPWPLSVKNCRYNINGFVEELPQLPENRFNHFCSAFPATGVRPAQPTFSLQALVVAGGRKDDSIFFSSVLTLLPGATAWNPLASLPRPLHFAQASLVRGRLRVNGGVDDGNSIRSEVMIVK